jgi:glycerate kinase
VDSRALAGVRAVHGDAVQRALDNVAADGPLAALIAGAGDPDGVGAQVAEVIGELKSMDAPDPVAELVGAAYRYDRAVRRAVRDVVEVSGEPAGSPA